MHDAHTDFGVAHYMPEDIDDCHYPALQKSLVVNRTSNFIVGLLETMSNFRRICLLALSIGLCKAQSQEHDQMRLHV